MRAAELPSPDDRHAVAAFAMSFDGYKHFGSFAACAEEAALKRRATLADLRNELFLAYRATRTSGDEPAVFVGVQGRRLSATILTRTFRHYATASGLNAKKRVTPHTLRHVFATELLSSGANLREIQELLGHKHLDSTQRYTRVNAHQLSGAVKRLPWTTQQSAVDETRPPR